ncbi:MAG: glutamate-5-semialdehyde dehydrogenase [Lachnospiraceae bacterium]|nr:glutamate-5-semialdehyde dehydrogenase [Lachnospiraceae bacterium]
MYLDELCLKAKNAKYSVAKLTREEKDNALNVIAKSLVDDEESILAANAKDIEAGVANGMHQGLLDRLTLNHERIEGMAEGIRQVAALDDPIGKILDVSTRPNGLKLTKITVPMGVIGIIYESRPNVTADAFALCFKAGSAVILKGGKDAINSNTAIVASIKKGLAQCGITEDAISLIEKTDRETTTEFMKKKEYVDLLIPRGGAGLIKAVVDNSTIPVIETGTGNCHIFVDESADFNEAIEIIFNAKTQRIGVCNACESLVIHENIVKEFLPKLYEKLSTKNVEIRGDKASCEALSEAKEATEEDFYKEYLDYILSVKTVSNTEEAIDFINEHNTGHSDAILSKNEENIRKFLQGVDSACVYANASTRFTDGFEFGFGAEIGISTQKLHARGPMGLEQIVSYKYLIEGNGQVRG